VVQLPSQQVLEFPHIFVVDVAEPAPSFSVHAAPILEKAISKGCERPPKSVGEKLLQGRDRLPMSLQ
jgi:hypothetical protein